MVLIASENIDYWKFYLQAKKFLEGFDILLLHSVSIQETAVTSQEKKLSLTVRRVLKTKRSMNCIWIEPLFFHFPESSISPCIMHANS